MNKKELDPKIFVIRPDTPVSDIDLDKEVFMLDDGTRLTEDKAEQIEDALAERRIANLIPGRKSLAGDGSHSPIVQFRSPRKNEGQEIADELGISLSEFARRAYDAYLDNPRATTRKRQKSH